MLKESISDGNFYDLFGRTVYVYDTDYRGANEYIIYYKEESGKNNEYVGDIKDIEEDFVRTEKSFEIEPKKPKILPKPKVIKKPKKSEYFDIVFYMGNKKLETIKYNVHKTHAYPLKGYFQKLEKYRRGTVKLERR
jgi:hypothetical protein